VAKPTAELCAWRNRRGGRGVFVVCVLAALAWGTETSALGAVEHPSIEETVLGVRGILSCADPLAADGSPPARLFVEFSENRLYAIAGLRMPGVRAGVRAGRVALTGAVARLSTDIGHETLLSLTPAWYENDRWAVSAGVVYESAYVHGCVPARLLGLTVRSRVRLTRSVSVGGEVDRYRLSGGVASNGGADATLLVVVRPLSGTSIFAVADLDRWTGVLPSVSMSFGGVKGLRLTFGYEAVTSALKGALALRFGGIACAAGVDYHPVLGARRGITLSWRR
jgi:hypothetical protein